MNIKMGNGSSISMSDKDESVKSIFTDDKEIIAKQAEQIKMLRSELVSIRNWFDIIGHAKSCADIDEVLESTKEQA